MSRRPVRALSRRADKLKTRSSGWTRCVSCCGRSDRGRCSFLDGSRRRHAVSGDLGAPGRIGARAGGRTTASCRTALGRLSVRGVGHRAGILVAGMVRGAPAALVLLVVLGLAGVSDGRQMKLAELNHCSRSMGANEWWDAVTGADEYGDIVTTFMHKRWGTALQVLSPQPRAISARFCMQGAARERVLATLSESKPRTIKSNPAYLRGRACVELARCVSCSCTTKRGTATCPSASSQTCRGFPAARRGQRRSCFLGLGRCVCPLRCPCARNHAVCCAPMRSRARPYICPCAWASLQRKGMASQAQLARRRAATLWTD